LTVGKIEGLGLFWPESIYLIDPPELKPVGFVWVGCPPHRKSRVALGRRPEVSNLESRFLVGLHLVRPGYRKTLIDRSYTGICFIFRDIPALVPSLTYSFLSASQFFWLLLSSVHPSSFRIHLWLNLYLIVRILQILGRPIIFSDLFCFLKHSGFHSGPLSPALTLAVPNHQSGIGNPSIPIALAS
jgi:hypothetical protein